MYITIQIVHHRTFWLAGQGNKNKQTTKDKTQNRNTAQLGSPAFTFFFSSVLMVQRTGIMYRDQLQWFALVTAVGTDPVGNKEALSLFYSLRHVK